MQGRCCELEMREKRGKLLSRELAEFVYLGFISRIGSKMLNMSAKLEGRIAAELEAGRSLGQDSQTTAEAVSTLFTGEIENSIRSIKQMQQENLAQWQKQ